MCSGIGLVDREMERAAAEERSYDFYIIMSIQFSKLVYLKKI
jgi:hypothetical protein